MGWSRPVESDLSMAKKILCNYGYIRRELDQMDPDVVLGMAAALRAEAPKTTSAQEAEE